jgi:OTU domain-containing protein 6
MSDAEETPDGQSESPLDTLVSRHRKESKELQARITAIKKQAGGDKKKKKETADQIASLEDELKKRHAKEKADLEAEMASKAPEPSSVDNLASLSLEDKEDDEHDDQQNSTDPKKKRNRQKERKERKAAELEAARLEAAEEAKNLPNWKKLEDDALRKMVEKDGLLLKEIAADGHCLYNAVGDQVGGKSYKELRKAAAEHMREHKDDYLPFMTDQNGDMLDDGWFCSRLLVHFEFLTSLCSLGSRIRSLPNLANHNPSLGRRPRDPRFILIPLAPNQSIPTARPRVDRRRGIRRRTDPSLIPPTPTSFRRALQLAPQKRDVDDVERYNSQLIPEPRGTTQQQLPAQPLLRIPPSAKPTAHRRSKHRDTTNQFPDLKRHTVCLEHA